MGNGAGLSVKKCRIPWNTPPEQLIGKLVTQTPGGKPYRVISITPPEEGGNWYWGKTVVIQDSSGKQRTTQLYNIRYYAMNLLTVYGHHKARLAKQLSEFPPS